jgi:uncharacterized delta-60 repeat protein
MPRLLFACTAAILALAAPAQAASLDPAFGSGGRVIVDFGGMSSATAGDLAIQPDGRIVAVGYVNGTFAVLRLLPTGALDPSFGSGGVVLSDFGAQAQEGRRPQLALQPDGKIVVAGPAYQRFPPLPYDFAAMRLNSDGSFDTSFGNGGKVLVPVGKDVDITQALALQPDGKIVLAGYTQRDMWNADFAAVRLMPNGALDPSFGSGGTAMLPMDPDSGLDSASAVAMTPTGEILLAGVTARPETGFDFAVVRLTRDGVLDTSFGTGGRSVLALGSGAWQEIVRSLLVLPDGSFWVGGAALQPGFGPSQVALAHFTANGVPDRQVLQPLGTIEDTSSGIVADGTTIYVAVDSRVTPAERQIGLLTLDGPPPFLFHMTAGGDDRAAGLARRADGALVELATVRAPDSGNSVFGVAVVIPQSAKPVEPPPAGPTNPAEEPVAPVSAITAPRRGSKVRRVTVLRGTAKGLFGVQRVDIALVRRSGRTCMYLKSTKPTWQVRKLRRASSRCTQLVWRTATGTKTWKFALRRALPRGSYALYSRATGNGLTESPPPRIAFTVR